MFGFLPKIVFTHSVYLLSLDSDNLFTGIKEYRGSRPPRSTTEAFWSHQPLSAFLSFSC